MFEFMAGQSFQVLPGDGIHLSPFNEVQQVVVEGTLVSNECVLAGISTRGVARLSGKC